MLLTILQYMGTGLGVISCGILTFMPRFVVLAMVLSSISCVLLSTWGFITANFGIALSQSIYILMYSYGAYNWFKVRDKEENSE